MTQAIANTASNNYTFGTVQEKTSGGTVSKDEFLKLLTYQLKNQDPLKPYDNQEFASQLAQFSQLEQLTGIKQLLEEQSTTNSALSNTISNAALPGLIGKSAKAISSTISYSGEGSVAIGYTLPYKAAEGKLLIKNSSGNVIRTMDLSSLDLAVGDHKLKWDGKNDLGDQVDEGSYTFSVTANDSSGSSISSTNFIYGKIDSVRFKTDGTKLVMNGVEVALENILDITTDS